MEYLTAACFSFILIRLQSLCSGNPFTLCSDISSDLCNVYFSGVQFFKILSYFGRECFYQNIACQKLSVRKVFLFLESFVRHLHCALVTTCLDIWLWTCGLRLISPFNGILIWSSWKHVSESGESFPFLYDIDMPKKLSKILTIYEKYKKYDEQF